MPHNQLLRSLDIPGLREPVFFDQGRTVFVWAMVDNRGRVKFPWGGGLGASHHSSVFASHGFCGAFGPQIQLPMKLITKKICDAPSTNALMLMNSFIGWKCAKLG